MRIRINLTFLLLFVFLGSPAVAQETPSAGADALPNSEIKNFQNWTVQCVTNPDTAEKNCVLFQSLGVESGQRLLTMQISNVPSTESALHHHALILTVPLGVHLPSGLQVQVDKGPAITFPYERCDQSGCYAGAVFNDSLREALTKGSSCKVSFNNLTGKSITATLSLSGFTAAYRNLIEL